MEEIPFHLGEYGPREDLGDPIAMFTKYGD